MKDLPVATHFNSNNHWWKDMPIMVINHDPRWSDTERKQKKNSGYTDWRPFSPLPLYKKLRAIFKIFHPEKTIVNRGVGRGWPWLFEGWKFSILPHLHEVFVLSYWMPFSLYTCIYFKAWHLIIAVIYFTVYRLNCMWYCSDYYTLM
jgi:hypothetical protein